jgi:hypothetical protein
MNPDGSLGCSGSTDSRTRSGSISVSRSLTSDEVKRTLVDSGADKSATLLAKDAVFFSPHKMVGGPGTPGVLVVKAHCLRNETPTMPGGGTILFVTPSQHEYLHKPEER